MNIDLPSISLPILAAVVITWLWLGYRQSQRENKSFWKVIYPDAINIGSLVALNYLLTSNDSWAGWAASILLAIFVIYRCYRYGLKDQVPYVFGLAVFGFTLFYLRFDTEVSFLYGVGGLALTAIFLWLYKTLRQPKKTATPNE